MNYEKVNWTTGTKVKEGYTIINGQTYQTVQPEYTGATPINAENLNHMDDQISKLSHNYIVESGTNYIRYSNGLQIAWVEKSLSITMSEWGSIYYYDISNLPNWEKPFTQVYQQHVTSDNKQFWFGCDDGTTTAPGVVRIYRPTSGTYNIVLRIIAIGNWA